MAMWSRGSPGGDGTTSDWRYLVVRAPMPHIESESQSEETNVSVVAVVAALWILFEDDLVERLPRARVPHARLRALWAWPIGLDGPPLEERDSNKPTHDASVTVAAIEGARRVGASPVAASAAGAAAALSGVSSLPGGLLHADGRAGDATAE